MYRLTALFRQTPFRRTRFRPTPFRRTPGRRTARAWRLACPLVCAALAAPLLAGAPAQAGSLGGCTVTPGPGNTWIAHCGSGSSLPGSSGAPGPGGRNTTLTCTLIPMTAWQVSWFRLPKAPPGEHWYALDCPGTSPFGGVTLAGKGAGGQPAVSPQEMMQYALSRLRIPVLRPGTAPPLHHDGLVGLPEWFWIPRPDWYPVSVTARAGPVWATVTAVPQQLTFYPGGGLPAASCAGPGTAYRRGGPAASACTYTYGESSALEPGGAYSANVTVTWRVSWTGSGGAGGVIDAGQQIGYPFPLRVAEGQALVRG